MVKFKVVAFDADDTLWHNERTYVKAQDRITQLLAPYLDHDSTLNRLLQTETQNLPIYGYGMKAFGLSMIETALKITDHHLSGRETQTLIGLVKEMLSEEVDLLDHVEETLALLASRYFLILLTKGDLFEQEEKIAHSGLSKYFQAVEIVAHKSHQSYKRIIARYNIDLSQFVMVGNSLRSDIWPILELGGHAVYIPYKITWTHETAELPATNEPCFHRLDHIGQLITLLDHLESKPE